MSSPLSSASRTAFTPVDPTSPERPTPSPSLIPSRSPLREFVARRSVAKAADPWTTDHLPKTIDAAVGRTLFAKEADEKAQGVLMKLSLTTYAEKKA